MDCFKMYRKMIEQKNIPYSEINKNGKLSIEFPKSATSVPSVFHELTTEVTGCISIYNTQLKTVTGFNQLQSVGNHLSIWGNTALQSVTGFENLKKIEFVLILFNNPNLVALSIPSTIIGSVDYKKYFIHFESKHEFKSPDEFVNSDDVIQDCIEKFNPGLHGDTVVTQICDNLELWGTDETKDRVMQHLLSTGFNPDVIPQQFLNRYHYDTIRVNNEIILDSILN